MPTITLDKSVFERLVGKQLPLEDLKDRISMLGTDLEKIEGNEIEVEIFPNRPDMLSEPGLARALASFIGVKTGLRQYEVKESGEKIIIDKSVKEVRPFTACAIVKNLTFDDEKIKTLIQIQEKLAVTHGRDRKKSAYGIYPLDSISFPIHYIAKDPKEVKFKPLGFDHFISAKDVPHLHPKGRAYAHLTENWTKYPFFIDNQNKVMCMLPFTNSEDTGKVDHNTKNVFIECSGTDFRNVKLALNMIVTALADLGGEIYSLELNYPDETIISPNLAPERMKLDLRYINKRLGLKLSETEAIELLARMGHGYENGEVLIPAYRADILHPVDLAEDLAIAYGYENFTVEIPNVATIGAENEQEKLARKIREILIGLRMIEVKNYHLLTELELNQKMNLNEPLVSLKKVLGDYNRLRNSLLPSLIKNLYENQHHEYPQSLFEIGTVFNLNSNTETGVEETSRLGIVLAHEKTDFTEIKQLLDCLMTALGLKLTVTETQHQSYIEGRVGKIIVNEIELGLIGEFSPQVISNWNLNVPIVGLELDLNQLFSLL